MEDVVANADMDRDRHTEAGDFRVGSLPSKEAVDGQVVLLADEVHDTGETMERAKEILLTGRPFTAQQALEWGMVNRVSAPDAVLREALETAAVIASNAPVSVRQAKQSINYGLNMDLASGLMFEIEAYNRMVPTEDRREGVRAFNEKRKPVFKGR